MGPRRDETARLQVRIPAREPQVALLRAHLRLWLTANRVGDESDAADVLAAATRAFVTALWRPGPVRTLMVDVEARYADGVVHVAVHDHAGRGGNTVHFRRWITPSRALARANAQPL